MQSNNSPAETILVMSESGYDECGAKAMMLAMRIYTNRVLYKYAHSVYYDSPSGSQCEDRANTVKSKASERGAEAKQEARAIAPKFTAQFLKLLDLHENNLSAIPPQDMKACFTTFREEYAADIGSEIRRKLELVQRASISIPLPQSPSGRRLLPAPAPMPPVAPQG